MYCPDCKIEVESGEYCPLCGRKLVLCESLTSFLPQSGQYSPDSTSILQSGQYIFSSNPYLPEIFFRLQYVIFMSSALKTMFIVPSSSVR